VTVALIASLLPEPPDSPPPVLPPLEPPELPPHPASMHMHSTNAIIVAASFFMLFPPLKNNFFIY
jgi:hypothetical protein